MTGDSCGCGGVVSPWVGVRHPKAFPEYEVCFTGGEVGG